MSLLIALLLATTAAAPPIVLDAASHRLGTPGKPEWDEFVAFPVESRSLEVRFPARAVTHETTLSIRQRGVKLDWGVHLNGRPIGRLVTMEESLVHTLAVPAGLLKEGENVLRIISGKGDDDIVVGEITLDRRPLAQVLGETSLEVRVSDSDSKADLPCRITVVDERGALASLHSRAATRLAVRPGVVYTADGRARLGIRPGRYTVFATRGFEYGVDQRDVTLEPGQSADLALAIGREVATPGLAACDTHVHTLTHSGHGDATLEERLVTLAGEGIELPIATDHNHLTDYRPALRATGLSAFFTPVIGDEITTRRGHFNAFPFAVGEAVPDFHSDDWTALIKGIRTGSEPVARVVILNHPRDLHGTFRPFDPAHFNDVTGAPRSGSGFDFDALEVLNSGAMQSDPYQVVRDWFALWNRGTCVTAVASSDSHDVSRFTVGQGRTYVVCDDSDVARIDASAACRSLLAGRALISFGLLVDLTVNNRYHAGDLATALDPQLQVTARVLGPSWTRADRIELYANGTLIREQPIEPAAAAGEKARITWEIPRPAHDVALVAIAAGPGSVLPFWATPRPYQPTSPTWQPRWLGLTNPIRVDADGDGAFSTPYAQAVALVARTGADPERLLPALATVDEAVAAQAADLCQAAGRDVRGDAFGRPLAASPEPVRRGFAAFSASLGPP